MKVEPRGDQEHGGGAGLSLSELRSRVKVEPRRDQEHGGGAGLSLSELRSCVKVEVAVLGSPSLINLMISVGVKQTLKPVSHSWMDCLIAELFLNSCFSDTVFMTLLRAASSLLLYVHGSEMAY